MHSLYKGVYNIRLIRNFAIVIGVIMLMVIGVKYMLGSAEEKADYKKSLMPLVIGIFIALGILGIILLCSGKVCDYCGKYVFEYSEIMGEIICKDCFYS